MGEPWVKLERAIELSEWDHEREVEYNQSNRQRQKHEFYRNAFDYISENGIKGDYCEFGVHRARTFRMALTEARKHNLDQMRFWAFDSFEGLPSFDRTAIGAQWQPGALKTSEDEFRHLIDTHGIYVDNVRTVRAWFNDLDGRHHPVNGEPIALVTVDCDLAESAAPVFEFIAPLLQPGTIIYIDDWFVGYQGNPGKGVAGAFREFSRHNSWFFQPHMTIGWWGKSFITYR